MGRGRRRDDPRRFRVLRRLGDDARRPRRGREARAPWRPLVRDEGPDTRHGRRARVRASAPPRRRAEGMLQVSIPAPDKARRLSSSIGAMWEELGRPCSPIAVGTARWREGFKFVDPETFFGERGYNLGISTRDWSSDTRSAAAWSRAVHPPLAPCRRSLGSRFGNGDSSSVSRPDSTLCRWEQSTWPRDARRGTPLVAVS